MSAPIFGAADRAFALVPTAVQAGAYAANANDLALMDTTAAARTVTLPTAPADRTVVGVKIVAGANAVTVNTGGSDVFDVAGGAVTMNWSTLYQSTNYQYIASSGVWVRVSAYGASGGGGAVSSVFGRTGAVAAATNDYSFSQISGSATAAQLPSLDALTAPVAAVSMNTHNITHLVAGVSSTDAVNVSQLPSATNLLPIASGGTGQTTASAAFNALSPLTTLGDVLYGGASGADTRLAGSTSATKAFLTQTGTGSVSAAPAWGTIAAGDVPTLNQNTTGSSASCTGNAATATNLAGGATFPAYTAPKVVTLTDASTVTVNAASGNDFRLLMTSGVGSTRALGAPSSPVDGQRIDIMVTQDATGSRLLTYNAVYEFSTSLPSPTLSTAANLTDILGFIYNASKSKWLFVAFLAGFS